MSQDTQNRQELLMKFLPVLLFNRKLLVSAGKMPCVYEKIQAPPKRVNAIWLF